MLKGSRIETVEFLATGTISAHKNSESQTRTENQSSINELVSSLNTSIHILIDAMNKTEPEITEPTDSTKLFTETIISETTPILGFKVEHREGWLEWDAWEPCTMTCAFGSQIRKRECAYENTCNGSNSDFRSCPFIACENQANFTAEI